MVHSVLVYVGAGVTILLFILVITINYLQENYPEMLPYMLKDWKFLPKPLRTLETIDYVVQTYMEVVSLEIHCRTYVAKSRECDTEIF